MSGDGFCLPDNLAHAAIEDKLKALMSGKRPYEGDSG